METTAVSYGNEGMMIQIEAFRDHMLQLGALYGLNDPKVLTASRELDALIVRFYCIQLNKPRALLSVAPNGSILEIQAQYESRRT